MGGLDWSEVDVKSRIRVLCAAHLESDFVRVGKGLNHTKVIRIHIFFSASDRYLLRIRIYALHAEYHR